MYACAFSKCGLRPNRRIAAYHQGGRGGFPGNESTQSGGTAAAQVWSGWQCLACLHRAEAATRDEWLGPDTARCLGGFQPALYGTADFTKRFLAGVGHDARDTNEGS